MLARNSDKQSAMKALKPGAVIGILGGGQLGRMMAVAASRLGYHVHIYCPDVNCPAAEVSQSITAAPYEDQSALKQFCQVVDVVTLEFENIPLSTAKVVEQHKSLYPASKVLEICQHRLKEKQFINDCGIETAPFYPVTNTKEALEAARHVGLPCIFKTATMGYDGKGQIKVDQEAEIEPAFESLNCSDVIAEGFVNFVKEASIIVARGADGQSICFPLTHNIHKNHILHQSIAPAPLDEQTAKKAQHMATTLAEKLDLIGIMAVELFVGSNGELKVNELAPRPHNSGHWTMDACQIDQFEQTIRAVAGLPLLPVNQHSAAVMTNLIGEDINHWQLLASDPYNSVHHYGKKEVKAGRKMGHVTTLKPL